MASISQLERELSEMGNVVRTTIDRNRFGNTVINATIDSDELDSFKEIAHDYGFEMSVDGKLGREFEVTFEE